MQPDESAAVRSLILDGLREHWGTLDPALNHDLDDLAVADGDRLVLVAMDGSHVVGTGTIVRRDEGCAEIVRMSVDARHRRAGIGRLLVDELIAAARNWRVERLVLETTAAWMDVVRFYERCGFTLTHFDEGKFGRDAWFEMRPVE
jgi:GNAT superfamily N-acetyltransferase